jgi:hypothetical protein
MRCARCIIRKVCARLLLPRVSTAHTQRPSESATAYLVRKHRGLRVARRIIRNSTRSAELHDDDDPNSSQRAAAALAEAAEPRAHARARVFLLLWGVVLMLPDDIQGWVIDMASGGLTIVVFLVVHAVRTIEAHWQISTSAALALAALALVAYCAMRHKARSTIVDEDEPPPAERGLVRRPSRRRSSSKMQVYHR